MLLASYLYSFSTHCNSPIALSLFVSPLNYPKFNVIGGTNWSKRRSFNRRLSDGMDDEIEEKKNSLMDPNEYFEKNSIMKSKKWLLGLLIFEGFIFIVFFLVDSNTIQRADRTNLQRSIKVIKYKFAWGESSLTNMG